MAVAGAAGAAATPDVVGGISIGSDQPVARAAPTTTAGAHSIPFFPTASDPLGRQGFARIVNLSNREGTVSIMAFDDSGRTWSIALSVDARQTVHFNSADLEDGNASKGLADGTGRPSSGDWRLELTSDLDIRALSYIRTSDGFVTAMHDVVPVEDEHHRIAFFNPGSNTAQESLLRIVNPGSAEATVTIRGIDDRGASPGGAVNLSVPARGARTLTAGDLETGGADLVGALGDGAGKWRLVLEADRPIVAMSLLATPTGHLTNLSTEPTVPEADDGGGSADTYGAISYDFFVSQSCPGLAAGLALDQASEQAASSAARRACRDDGGSESECREETTLFEGCGALAYGLTSVGGCGTYLAIDNFNPPAGRGAAESEALATCRDDGSTGCRIWTDGSGNRISGCNTGNAQSALDGQSRRGTTVLSKQRPAYR